MHTNDTNEHPRLWRDLVISNNLDDDNATNVKQGEGLLVISYWGFIHPGRPVHRGEK